MIPPITEQIETLLSAFGFVAAMTIVAWALGFFRLPKVKTDNDVTILSTVGVFAIYFLVQLLLVPFVIVIYLYATEEKIPENLGSVLTKADVGWISFISIVSSTSAVLIYSFLLGAEKRHSIWNPGNHSIFQKFKSIVIGALSWLFVYPWVVVVGQLTIIIFILYQHEVPPNIDQEMVRHIKEIASDRPLFFATILSVIFIVPIAEELLFRGFLQNFLKKNFGVFLSIFMTSVFFAFLHFSVGQGFANWQIVLSLFVVSCFLGYLYERQRTLLAPIALHIAINGISIAILFL